MSLVVPMSKPVPSPTRPKLMKPSPVPIVAPTAPQVIVHAPLVSYLNIITTPPCLIV